MDMTLYYGRVFALCAQLDPAYVPIADAAPPGQKASTWRRSPTFVWLMSLTNESKDSYGGNCVAAPNPFCAAELIINETHRLATQSEIDAELLRQEKARAQILAEDQANRAKTTTLQVSGDAVREAIAALGLPPAKAAGK